MTTDITGTPCWLSLMARDLHTAQKFYAGVLGWTFRPTDMGQGFSVAVLDGVPIAGMGAVAADFAAPVAWTPYFAVDDADATVARIRESGGTVGIGPVAFPPGGRAALATDLEGACFGVWEGRVLSDWRVGDGDAPAWLELHTKNAFDAALFYGRVLEWVDGKYPNGCEVSYEQDQVVLRHEGQAVARLNSGPVDSGSPSPQLRPRWRVHFKVADLRIAGAAVLRHGGSIVAENQPPGGNQRLTVRDPEGGLFTLHRPGGAPRPPSTGMEPPSDGEDDD
ncbi:VOC family protein [Streptomyces sp. H27-H5]|uniref:VOC family protein n=1 Tax=Streptomyces sp. H27-H5 TaxID=2996460 RepID=UPI00226F0FB2|nr:VOC family protein [Streptomyces sp. H27-H5]MCY0962438.1 VOC family protein [Streptomyces sp. H27-H5]